MFVESSNTILGPRKLELLEGNTYQKMRGWNETSAGVLSRASAIK